MKPRKPKPPKALDTMIDMACKDGLTKLESNALNSIFVRLIGQSDTSEPEAPAPVPSGQNSREELHKQYAKDWQRQIISAGGDDNVALQAVTLAALNGLFDHLSTSNSPGANATEGQNG